MEVGVVVTVDVGVDQPQHVGVGAGEGRGRGDDGGGGRDVGLDVLELLLLVVAVRHAGGAEDGWRSGGHSVRSDCPGLAVLGHLWWDDSNKNNTKYNIQILIA